MGSDQRTSRTRASGARRRTRRRQDDDAPRPAASPDVAVPTRAATGPGSAPGRLDALDIGQVSTRLRARATRELRDLALVRRYPLVRLHARLADLTMVPKAQFVDNLVVARRARSVPGDLVECGAWRGGMSAALAWALPGRRSVLLDSFEGLPDAKEVDGPAAIHWSTAVREHDNCTAEERWAHEAMARVGQRDYELVRGWFDVTVPVYAATRRPIAVLRLDGDWYDSTIVCLEHLLPLVQPGGIVLIDDYFDWDGCSRAVHDHLSRTGSTERLRTSAAHEFAFIVKGAGPS